MKKAKNIRTVSSTTLAAILNATAVQPANATEGGGSVYQPGVENFVCCAVPPPGLYGLLYGQHYRADNIRGDAGQVVTPPTFQVRATAVVSRLIWVLPQQVAGASLAMHAILPVVNLDIHIAPGVSQRKTGAGDLVLGPALAWHHSPKLHTLAGVDIYAPTGSYRKTDLANIGRNYWAVQPLAGVSYIDPAGFNGDLKFMWTFNGKNKDTDYRSGQEIIVDYALGWSMGNGLTVGVGGYLYQQVSNDKQNGAKVPGSEGRAFAIGPSLKYDSQKGWFVTAKFQAERGVRNRAQGQAFWLKAVFPL